jgi:ferrous iron transport protein B
MAFFKKRPSSDATVAGSPIKVKKVALVGNPNVGKSVLFNALTGAYVTVSNYPGTSVEVARGNALIEGRAV